MSLTSHDLDQAVFMDIITEEQRLALLDLAGEQVPDDVEPSSEEEEFRFISGFNDIFLALGVVLFISAASLAVNLLDSNYLGYALAAAAMWLISEVLTARLRRAIPSMLAAGAFVVFALLATDGALSGLSTPEQAEPLNVYLLVISACLWSAVYFYRFRLPFSILLIGGAFVTLGFLICMTVVAGIGSLEDPFATPLLPAFYALISGLVVFIVALRFDRSDPQRHSLRADYGFWLHLLAAPLIVHALMYLVAGLNIGGFSSVGTVATALMVLAIFAVLSIVALIINRRAILVAALTYLGGALWYLMSQNDGIAGNAELLTMLLISLFVIGLGVGWHPIRRLLLQIPLLASIDQNLLSKQA